jgi:hypothetical protein
MLKKVSIRSATWRCRNVRGIFDGRLIGVRELEFGDDHAPVLLVPLALTVTSKPRLEDIETLADHGAVRAVEPAAEHLPGDGY